MLGPYFLMILLPMIVLTESAFSLGGGEKTSERLQSGTPAGVPLKEAMYYESLDDREVRCLLCFRKCLIRDGERGECRNRENKGGKLYSLVYALPSAIQLDPIEKEPQYHHIWIDPPVYGISKGLRGF